MAEDRYDHTVDLMVDPKRGDDFQRVELITGVGRRRKWSDEFKAQVVSESLEPGVVISDVARRHGLRPQQLFTWRNQMRSAKPGSADAQTFAAVAVSPTRSVSADQALPDIPIDHTGADLIEIVLPQATVRVRRGADTRTLVAVLKALKASP